MKKLLFIVTTLLLVPCSVMAISGQSVYDKYKETEKKMDTSFNSMIFIMDLVSEDTVMEMTLYRKGKKKRMESVIRKSDNPMHGKPGQKNIMIDDGVTSWTCLHWGRAAASP